MTAHELVNNKSKLTASTLFQWCGIAAIAAGILTITGSLGSTFLLGDALSLIYGLGTLFTIFALIGVYGVQVEGSGYWGLSGFILAVIGNIFLAGGEARQSQRE